MRWSSLLFHFAYLAGFAAPVVADDISQAFLRDADDPRRAIGLLVAESATSEERFNCTATLISPTEVLTAAHCVIDPSGAKPAAPEDLIYFAGRTGRDFIASRKISAVRLEPRFDVPTWADSMDGASAAPVFAIHTDLAILTLAQPIEDVAPLTLSADTDYAGPVALLGYGASANRDLVSYAGCDTIPLSQEAVGLTCAAEIGVSGAALFAPTESGWTIIGTVAMVSKVSHWMRTMGPRVTLARIATLRSAE